MCIQSHIIRNSLVKLKNERPSSKKLEYGSAILERNLKKYNSKLELFFLTARRLTRLVRKLLKNTNYHYVRLLREIGNFVRRRFFLQKKRQFYQTQIFRRNNTHGRSYE